MGKIYLLETHLYTKDLEHVYKVGKSDQKGMNRLKDYHKECEIILVIACEDSLKIEAELLKRFKQKYTLYTHREYFVGDKYQMMDDIIEVVRNERIEKKYWKQVKKDIDSFDPLDHMDPKVYYEQKEIFENRKVNPIMLNREHVRIPSPI